MKYLVKIFVITLLLFNCTILLADQTIAFIDMKKVMNESKAGKLAQNELKKEHEENIQEFQKIEENLKKEETELLAQKSILNKEDYKKKITILREKVQNYQTKRRDRLDKITKKRATARKKLLEVLTPILQEYSTANKISIILYKKDVVIGKMENDLTQIIIEKLNKKLPSIKL
jgi:outer membrane protein